jgi:hypothetical protein
VKVSYSVKNYSRAAVPYAPKFSEEAFYSPVIKYAEYRLSYGTGYVLNEDRLPVRTVPATGVRAVDTLPEVTIAPQELCNVVWRNVSIMPVHYSDVTGFGGPTGTATLEADEILPDLDFVSAGEHLEHLQGSRTWKFNRPFIQGQHVRVWWFPKQ